MRTRLRQDPGLALLLAALLAALVLYLPTLATGLTNYDDQWLYTHNYVVQQPSLASLRTIFLDLDLRSPGRWALTPEYLPVRDLSVMLDYAVWGTSYGGFHATNLALYLGALGVWFAVLAGFGLDRTLVGVAILVWAVHPVHAESVAWLSERKGLLAALFAGLAALGYVRFRAGGSPRWLIGAALATVAAVWSKAPAAFYLATLAGLELALPARRLAWRRSLVGLAAIAVAGGLAFAPVLAIAAQAAVVGGASAVPGGWLSTVLGVHGFYVELVAMVPANAVRYPIADAGPTTRQLVLGAVVLVAVVGVLAAPRTRISPAARAAAVIWAFAWLPISHALLPLHLVAVADRYAFVLALGAALGFAAAAQAIPSPLVRRAVIALVVVLASVRAYGARTAWGSSLLLWERAAESSPTNGEAWALYAEAYSSVGRPDLAQEVVGRGLAHGRGPMLLRRQAQLLTERGERDAARPLLQEAAAAGDGYAMANLALLEEAAGHTAEALAWARRGAEAAPALAHAHRVRGKLALAGGLPIEAEAAFRRALGRENSAQNRLNLALSLLSLERPAEARPLLESVRTDPVFGPRARAVLDSVR